MGGISDDDAVEAGSAASRSAPDTAVTGLPAVFSPAISPVPTPRRQIFDSNRPEVIGQLGDPVEYLFG